LLVERETIFFRQVDSREDASAVAVQAFKPEFFESSLRRAKMSDFLQVACLALSRLSELEKEKWTNFKIFLIPKYPSVTPSNTESVVFQEVAGQQAINHY
jgi:hypothetical protein